MTNKQKSTRKIKCINCGQEFSENILNCPSCNYPYMYNTVCFNCDFKSIKKNINCPKCKMMLFGGLEMIGFTFLELIITFLCVLGIVARTASDFFFPLVWLILFIVYIVLMVHIWKSRKQEKLSIKNKRKEYNLRS